MMMTWDEAKRQANLRKHGFDFVGCDANGTEISTEVV